MSPTCNWHSMRHTVLLYFFHEFAILDTLKDEYVLRATGKTLQVVVNDLGQQAVLSKVP